jgi:hypothetical protein
MDIVLSGRRKWLLFIYCHPFHELGPVLLMASRTISLFPKAAVCGDGIHHCCESLYPHISVPTSLFQRGISIKTALRDQESHKRGIWLA